MGVTATELALQKAIAEKQRMVEQSIWEKAMSGVYDDHRLWKDMIASSAMEPFTSAPISHDTPTKMRQAILARLRADKLPFKFWEVQKLNENTVVLFIIHNEKPILIEDGWDLFPSDALVSQLRLLAG